MIIWINGPFGIGKTTTARQVQSLLPDALVFDTEAIGYAIRPTLATAFPVDDFQDWPVWRESVVAVLSSMKRFTERTIVVPQSVLVEPYWCELSEGLLAQGIPLRAFTLDASDAEHERRIAGDTREPASTARWRRTRAADFRAARSWLRARTTLVDTDGRTPAEVARGIVDRS